jgi:plastocyanin
MRKSLARFCLAGLALALIFVAATGSGATALPQATTVINFGTQGALTYDPAYVLVHTGDTVTWNGQFGFHPLVSETGLWPTVATGSTFSYTFNQPGLYRFFCLFHGRPGGLGMAGAVWVVSGPVHAVSLPLIAH